MPESTQSSQSNKPKRQPKKQTGLYQRNGTWYLDIRTESGERIRRSTGTQDYQQAKKLLEQLKHELWQQQYLNIRPKRLWDEAAAKWLKEKQDKKSIRSDIGRLRALGALRGKDLASLDRRTIMQTVIALPCGNSTKNRYLALIRAILNKAAREWEWLDHAPRLTLYQEPKKRIRWLKPTEAQKLLDVLAQRNTLLHDLAAFSLATGLRQRNVLELKWEQIDIQRRTAWINADQTKGGQAIGVPLNQTALHILQQQKRNAVYVFTQNNGKKLHSISSRIWKGCLKEAGIHDFRWHDLRHTWASWLIQRGVPIAVLKEMGGWENAKMVERYAHLSSEHLLVHADVLDTIWTQENNKSHCSIKENRLNNCLDGINLAPRAGLEPATCGLTVRRSTD